MRKLLTVVMILGLPITVRLAPADMLSDYAFNISGTLYCNPSSFTGCTNDITSYPGTNAGGFSFTTGEGTITVNFDPGIAGSYYLDAWFNNALAVPFYNEYGSVGGNAAANQSWEIGDAQLYYNYAGSLPAPAGTDIGDDTNNNTLQNSNSLPGAVSNYLNNCTGATCNGDASMAMGFSFILGANQDEVATFTLSEFAPSVGTFYLEQIHPADANNASETDLYLTGNAATYSVQAFPPSCCPPEPNVVPEPSSLSVCTLGLLYILQKRNVKRHRRAAESVLQ